MSTRLSKDQPISISVLAIGGQGGGVLTSWLVKLAESQGWHAQSTSVPGVAQRTGATLYHVEMMPRSTNKNDQSPVFSLMPVPGEVDLVVAAEFSEVARAIQRDLVSRERTTLIASTHRALAISEKSAPTINSINNKLIDEAGGKAAHAFYKADMAAIAARHGSVISASLFGAIAATGALPFKREMFETAIRDAGVGVAASLDAFAGGFDAISLGEHHEQVAAPDTQSSDTPRTAQLTGGSDQEKQAYAALLDQITSTFDENVQEILHIGVNRVVDFQDTRYGAEYLQKLNLVQTADRDLGGGSRAFSLTREVVKYLANAMAYQDVIRIADLKIRETRFARLRREISAPVGEIIKVREYMHPRLEEICSMLSPKLSMQIADSRIASGLIRFFFEGGKRVRTDSLSGFLQLYVLSGLRNTRRQSARHATEMKHIDHWLDKILQASALNYDLALEIAQCQRLVKGFGDTHARGISKYSKVLSGIEQISQRSDAADWARRLRMAALEDAEGDALAGTLKTIDSFTGEPSKKLAS